MTNIRDNQTRGGLGDFLYNNVTPNANLSIVSAYFTIFAYYQLRDKFDQIGKLNFLFGEPSFLKIDPSKTTEKTFELLDDDAITLSGNKLQQNAAAKACAQWIKDKVQIKSVEQSNFLHGKLYHIQQADQTTKVAMGSSNFTVRGLGLGKDGKNNIELNTLINDANDQEELKKWFDELWNSDAKVTDVTQKVLDYLDQVYKDHSPEFIYFKTLYHIFENYLKEEQDNNLLFSEVTFKDTQIWKTLFEFQRDAVARGIKQLSKYNGFIIADSVGLGKTFTALGIIKYYELKRQKVLVLCPKKLERNWTAYQHFHKETENRFHKDHFNYTVLAHTDLSREKGKVGNIDLSTFDWGNYDLVVIDESHNFRNDKINKNTDAVSRYQRLLEDIIQNGRNTKVLLLSATPVNNNLRDLRNQFNLIAAGNDTAFIGLDIVSIKELMKNAQTIFTHWTRIEKRKVNDLINDLSEIPFFKLLDELSISRSRKQIQEHYAHEMEKIGSFPNRYDPIAIYAELDLQKQFLTYDQINNQLADFKLAIFFPSNYLTDEAKKSGRYEIDFIKNFNQAKREEILVQLMKINFLKRLESSIFSFTKTLHNIIQRINELLEKIQKFKEKKAQTNDIDWEKIVQDIELLNDFDDADKDIANLLTGSKLKFFLNDIELEQWTNDLNEDLVKLTHLHEQAQTITPQRDAKLDQLKNLITQKLQNANNPQNLNKKQQANKKVLIFTAFADTANYLYQNIHQWATNIHHVHTGLVVGSGSNHATYGNTEFNKLLTNFAPIAKQRNTQDAALPQIDILIATDCISEGQNLQDCDYLINYDIHWNPVRIVQRFGRIDRIGSLNYHIQMVNFWPTNDLDNYINLKDRVEARMALVDMTASNNDNLLDTEQLEDIIDKDLNYRNQQIKRLQNQNLDLEDTTEAVTLNQFSLDDFRFELLRFIKNKEEQLRKAPWGIYSVVPSADRKYIPDLPNAHEIVKEGVIFCFKQLNANNENKNKNQLHPYFLLYIHNNGHVQYTFTKTKQILDLYRQLCLGKVNAITELCTIFDQQTKNGENMEQYTTLVKKAIRTIKKTFQEVEINNLFTNPHALLSNQQDRVNTATDLQLVTWLIVV